MVGFLVCMDSLHLPPTPRASSSNVVESYSRPSAHYSWAVCIPLRVSTIHIGQHTRDTSRPFRYGFCRCVLKVVSGAMFSVCLAVSIEGVLVTPLFRYGGIEKEHMKQLHIYTRSSLEARRLRPEWALNVALKTSEKKKRLLLI